MSDFDDEDHLSGEVSPWVMSAYIMYSSMLLLKLLSNVLLIGWVRFRSKVVSNPEDVSFAPGDKKEVKVGGNHPLLQRVTRMHQNDLENIIPFFMLGFLHVMTWYQPYRRPLWHFRIFFVSRMLTSFCHFFALQPFRSIFFFVGMCVNVSLGLHVLIKAVITGHAWQYL